MLIALPLYLPLIILFAAHGDWSGIFFVPIAMLPTFMAFFCRWRIKSVRPYFASAISFSFDFGLFGYLLLDRLMPGPEVFVVYFVVSVPIWLLGFAGVLLAQRSFSYQISPLGSI